MAFGLDADTLTETLQAISEFASRTLPVERILELDRDDECPVDTVRQMCGDELGIQLLFIPEEYGGMGGGDLRRLPGLRDDGRHRPGGGHQRARDLPRQRPDHGRRRPRTSRSTGWAGSPRRACCSPTARPSPRPAATSAR